MDNYWTATVPMPPSHNDNHRYAKIEAIREAMAIAECKLAQCRYSLHIELHAVWKDAQGRERKRDPGNYMKFLVDAIRDAVGVDDRWFKRIIIEAIDTEGDEYAVCTLTPLDDTTP